MSRLTKYLMSRAADVGLMPPSLTPEQLAEAQERQQNIKAEQTTMLLGLYERRIYLERRRNKAGEGAERDAD